MGSTSWREPYDESCIKLLQWFVDSTALNIMLDIHTNATVFNDEFLIPFAQFKHVELMASVEATDELYSIVRGGPYTWQQLNDNVEKFYEIENLEMVFAVTVMTTNLFDLAPTYGNGLINTATRASISMSNVVVNSLFKHCTHANDNLRHKALDKLKDIPGEAYRLKAGYTQKNLNT